MSGSNEGVMRNVDALFGIDIGGATSSPSQANSSAKGMRVAAYDGTPVYKSITPPGSSPPPPSHHPHMNGAQTNEYQQQQMMMMKKKRGRPRKYSGAEGTDGNMSLSLMPHPPPPLVTQPAIPASSSAHHLQTPTTTGGGEFSPASGGGSEGQATFKKARGRPPGSTNKIKKNHQPQHHPQPQPQPLLLPLGSPGVEFTPHVIFVKAGEDVSSKIMSFSQNGPRAVCILSANGSISNVTLRQTATSGGTATYEGRFEILSLCGSFLLTEVAGHRSRTGGLSVSLAGPDGRVLGGCVAGLLTAASPIQVIVGSFIPDGKKELMKTVNHTVEPTHNFSSLPMPIPMSMSLSLCMPPMLFSGSGGGGGIYAPPPTTAGVTSGSPLSQAGGDRSFDEESSDQEEDEEGGSPPDHGTGGTAATNHHHHINNGNPHAMLGMPWR